MQNSATREVQAPGAGELEQTYREHAGRVFQAAYRITGNAHDAEDVLQTVFVRLLGHGGGSHLADGTGAYLRRAAINAGLDILRARRVARATPLEGLQQVLATPTRLAPDAAADSAELREHVRRGLADVSPRSAEIFALRYFEGYDNHEIAHMLGTSRSTIAVVLHRCRRHLREVIGKELGEKP